MTTESLFITAESWPENRPSAKSRLKAVRRAIFWDAEQREEVRQALEKINPKRVLILGTSDRMVETICKALGLPNRPSISGSRT